MEKLQYTIHINASPAKVYETMLGDKTYSEWTSVFNPTESSTSSFVGSWSEGSDIDFVGSDKDGKVSGMYAKIKANRPNEFVSIQHLGEISDGEKKPFPGDGEFFENYTFTEKDGGTDLLIELDTVAEYKEMFNDMWPKGLAKLKEISER